jgi:hypothetical protein
MRWLGLLVWTGVVVVAYVVDDGVELALRQLGEVLVDVLVGEVAAEEDAVDVAALVGELGESTCGLAFIDELIQTWRLSVQRWHGNGSHTYPAG